MSGLGGTLNKINLGFKVAKTLGWRWALTRAYLAAEHRSGALSRRTPIRNWADYELLGQPDFQSPELRSDDVGQFLRDEGPEVEKHLRAHLERLKARHFDIFGTSCRLDSWHAEPITPAAYPSNQHWSEVQEAAEADLKLVWEPSRFGWAFDLVRLHALDPETAAPDLFWELFEDWCENNQPFAGINWKCGQETAIRLMAVVFAATTFWGDGQSPERRRLLASFADVTARRIMAHWRYAKSQDNNHIVSEAVGLISVGLLFPNLDCAAAARSLGEKLLTDACERLVFPDGGTSQYSLNYHRVFMDNFIWAHWLYEQCDAVAPAELKGALERTYSFLLAITQKSDGAAGNWGNNDGALLLPLASTRHLDVRPTLLMAARSLYGSTHDWGGPAEEATIWLWGQQSSYLPNEPEPAGIETRIFPYAGLSIIVNGAHRAILRGGEHQLFRPPQCDFGHVELWLGGEQIVFDPGTSSYKPGPDDPDLSETQHHNGPQFAGQPQMIRLSRFLWGDWPSVRTTSESNPTRLEQVCDGPNGYRRIVTPHKNGWLISDELSGDTSARELAFSAVEMPSDPVWHQPAHAYRQIADGPSPTWTGGRSDASV